MQRAISLPRTLFRTRPIPGNGSCFSRRAPGAAIFWWMKTMKLNRSPPGRFDRDRARPRDQICRNPHVVQGALLADHHYAAVLEVADIHTQGLVAFLGGGAAVGADDSVAGASTRVIGFFVAGGPGVGFSGAVDAQALLAVFQVSAF